MIIIQITEKQLTDLIYKAVSDAMERYNKPKEVEDELFTVPQAAEFLSLSVATIYGLNHQGDIPSMKRSKRLYFSKKDLIDYLKKGKKKTNSELADNAKVLTQSAVATVESDENSFLEDWQSRGNYSYEERFKLDVEAYKTTYFLPNSSQSAEFEEQELLGRLIKNLTQARSPYFKGYREFLKNKL